MDLENFNAHFTFNFMDSLREIYLLGCNTNISLIDHLPDSLEFLNIQLLCNIAVNSVMKKPSCLRRLKLKTSYFIPEISNAKDLIHLVDISIHLDVERNEHPAIDFELVQSSISKLPSKVSKLSFHGNNDFQVGSMPSTDNVFFGNSPKLQDLDFHVDMIQAKLDYPKLNSLK
ncbi:unnamed protein product [Ambrosiozyma monospora]|uniref:Unnamed protein product n=1 Tax=Ambrosiozyma monospora TaxID=43982 RepID=A0ACB5T8L7_AMBMO|nr:unnamed protein product [Ambrosiozyma monospora]